MARATVNEAKAGTTGGTTAGSLAGADEELAARLRVAVTRLHRRLRQESLAGLSPSQGSALGSVSRLGHPTLGELAHAEQVQPPTMTRVVATMEAAGLVRREAEPADRRICRVALTDAGRTTLEEVRTAKTAFLARQLGALPARDRTAAEALTALLERLVGER